MVDHMQPSLRPKSDQVFSHSLSEQRTWSSVVHEAETQGNISFIIYL
jgi:hypothetical protein